MRAAPLALCVSAPALALVAAFESGANPNGWTFGTPQIEIIEPTGG